jgi:hypothetical protein
MSKLFHVGEKHISIGISFLHDRELDLKCRGLLTTMLSLPEGWNFSENGLRALFKKDDGTYTEGRDSIRSALAKLEKLGYLLRVRGRRDNGGFYTVDYYIASVKQEIFFRRENEYIKDRKSVVVGNSPSKDGKSVVADGDGFSNIG